MVDQQKGKLTNRRPLTLTVSGNIMMPTGVCFNQKKYVYFIGKLEEPLKNSKTICNHYLTLLLLLEVRRAFEDLIGFYCSSGKY